MYGDIMRISRLRMATDVHCIVNTVLTILAMIAVMSI